MAKISPPKPSPVLWERPKFIEASGYISELPTTER
jgi:hypothetical protein